MGLPRQNGFFKKLKRKAAPLVLAGAIAFGGYARAAALPVNSQVAKSAPTSSMGVKPIVGNISTSRLPYVGEFSRTNNPVKIPVLPVNKPYFTNTPNSKSSSPLRVPAGAMARRNVLTVNSPNAKGAGVSLSVRLPPVPISAARIDAELARMNSPVAGKGEFILRIAKAYNVDPAFFLGVARVESQCGTKGLARKTKNMCNVRWTKKSNYPQLNEFNVYPSWEKGIVGFFYQISRGNYYLRAGNHRVSGIIEKYAPKNENNTKKYIRDVEDYMQSLGSG